MSGPRVIHTVSAHACGEVGDVVVGGVSPPEGKTLWDQRDTLERDGTLRNILLNEPRGGVFRHVNLLVPPKHPDAQAAFLIMEPEDTPPMSGSNTMCVATVLLETGILPMTEPETRLRLEVPAGLIEVRAQCAGGRVTQVAFENVRSFADKLDAPLEVPGVGTLTVDTAFGGDSYCIVDAQALGFGLTPDEAQDIATLGAQITDAANAQLGFHHPTDPWSHISFCQFAGPLTREGTVLTGRNAVVIKPGKLDRSPCGTGSSARMAVLQAKGQMGPGDTYLSRSIIGAAFTCRIVRHDDRGIIPEVAGQAWITGTHQHMVAPDDPWPEGYRLSDTWPGA